LHDGQGRHFQLGQVVHQFGQMAGVVEIGVVVEFGRLLHPGQIGTGTEMLAAPAQYQKTHGWICLHGLQSKD